MSTLESENNLIINRQDNRSINVIVNDTGNSNDNNTDIFVPDTNFEYQKKKSEELDNDLNSQFLITSANQPKTVEGIEQVENLILKYVKSDGTIQWVRDLETLSLGSFPNKISQTIQRTLPLGDFFTDIQTNVDNFNTSTNNETEEGTSADTKYRWINMNATIIDIGLHQLTWNSNKQYYHLTDNLNNSTSSPYQDFPLNISCANSDDTSLSLKVKYLTKDSDEELTKYICNISNYNTNIETTPLNCYKINSAEIIPSSNTTTFNKGEIELYFKVPESSQASVQTQFNNGISQVSVQIVSGENCFSYNCFAYNCDYLNCEYYNMYFNRNINFRSTENTNINSSNTSITHLSSITDVLFPTVETLFELEGGKGRKATIQVKRESAADNSNVTFKIVNPGYLYQTGDLLRIKDKKYRNLIFFTVNNVNSNSISVLGDTKFTQEIIKAQHGKSNTIKYSLGKKESLLLKDLTISGSTQAKILVRLIQISKPNNNLTLTSSDVIGDVNLVNNNAVKNSQKVLKEFYYFNRSNINDIHHINQYILQESEVYIDIQKLLETSDNDSTLLDTLTFNLNGIKIKLEDGTAANTFIMQRDN